MNIDPKFKRGDHLQLYFLVLSLNFKRIGAPLLQYLSFAMVLLREPVVGSPPPDNAKCRITFLKKYSLFSPIILAESCYNVKSSNITSKIPLEILSNENKTKWCFQKNSLFWHFDSCFVLRTTETPVFIFSLLGFLD